MASLLFQGRLLNGLMPTKNKRQDKGFTLLELMIVVAIIGILAAIAMYSLIQSRNKAKNVLAENDLANFVIAQQAYFAQNDTIAGDVSQKIRNDGTPSDFKLPGFVPSSYVIITIASGDKGDPFNEISPITFESHYSGLSKTFVYNFRDRVIQIKP